jgi:hypothetical protein
MLRKFAFDVLNHKVVAIQLSRNKRVSSSVAYARELIPQD